MAERYKPTTMLDSLKASRNVIAAVILRDMRTRFFNHGLGYLIVAIWPLSHMLLLIGIYTFMGRVAPYGDSLRVFFATGLVPTLGFSYISRFMALSIIINKPMLAFPVVKPVDIMAARAILELLAAFLTLGLMIAFLVANGDNPWPRDIEQAVFGYLSSLFLAFSVGVVISVVGMIWSPIVTFYALFMIVVYITSGTLFVPSSLPHEIAVVLSYNPVLHCVEWIRTAYYDGYNSIYLDRSYVWEFSSVCLAAGLFLERVVRRIIYE